MKGKEKKQNLSAPRGELPLFENGRIEITDACGCKELLILGVVRILRFGEERMSFARRQDNVTVEGSGLCCVSYASGAVGIRGKVTLLSFASEEAAK